MLIKIDEGTYVNSDHIVTITPIKSAPHISIVSFVNGSFSEVPSPIAAYIAQTLDANEAFTIEQPTAMSLPSRIAVFLRNQSAGKTFTDLEVFFSYDSGDAIRAALNELSVANTVHALGVNEEDLLYYHASNPIFGAREENF